MCVKCAIKWIDAEGRETPDDNPAIGYAVVTFDDGSRGLPIPICASHAKRAMRMGNWRITPNEQVSALVRALLGPSKQAYETMRAELIGRLGYSAFRDLQSLAFELVAFEQV